MSVCCVFSHGKECRFYLPPEARQVQTEGHDPELLQALGEASLKAIAELTSAVPPDQHIRLEHLGPLLRLVSMAIEAGKTGRISGRHP